MGRLPRKIYTCEFKLETIRLVESGQRLAEAERSPGIGKQMQWNWTRAHKGEKLTARRWIVYMSICSEAAPYTGLRDRVSENLSAKREQI
jgi:transposase-like protein